MKFVRHLLLLPALVCQAEMIPLTQTTTLAGNAFTLPQDLRSDSVLILGFTQKSAAPTRDWRKALATLCDRRDLACLQMPILESVPRLFRGFVVRSVNKEVPQALKSSFLTVFEKESEWKRAVDYSQPDDAYILLVDPKGTVKWKTHGPPTEQNLRELRDTVRSEPRP